MTIIRAATNSYGPATLDIQIEQGCDFSLSLTLTKSSVPWDLTSATLAARMSPTWAPGQSEIDFTCAKVVAANGTVTISLPGSATAAIVLPSPPSKTRSSEDSRKFDFGGWAFYITDGGVTSLLIEGDVVLDRDPVRG